MAINYTWAVKALSKTSGNGLTDVIIGTRWECVGTDDSDNTTGTFIGATPFKLDSVDPDNFTEYSQLTEEQVLGWIKHHVSSSTQTGYWDHISDRIQKDINNKKGVIKNVDTFDLPWSPSSGSISGSVPI
jgi:hypothetical protein